MVSQNMVSQSKNGFPKYGFSIKQWFSKIWFLNHYMASIKWFLNHYMVSLKFLNRQMVPLYSFSIIWFHYMVSQSKNGIPKYGFSIKNGIPKYGFSIKKMEKTISFPFYGKTIFFNLLDSHRIFNLKMVPIKKSLTLLC